MDVIPLFSQVKSLVQVVAGDQKGAKQTQVNFSRQCPLVSQIRSFVEIAQNNTKAARETHNQFLRMVDNSVDAIPAVGHIKGGIHYATGNKAKGDASMKSSSRTTGVMVGGATGFAMGGPIGAVAGGVSGGAAMDGIITGADSAINENFTPYGNLEIIQHPTDPGKWCDVVGGALLDGFTGKGSGLKTKTVCKVFKATIPHDGTSVVLSMVPEQKTSKRRRRRRKH